MNALLIKVGFCDALVWSLNTNEVRKVAAMENFYSKENLKSKRCPKGCIYGEEEGISWPLEEGSETNPKSCFPHTYGL